MNIFTRRELLLDVIVKVDYNFGRNLFVVNEKKQLIGVVSQGDLVRILSKDISVKSTTLNDVMNLNPVYLEAGQDKSTTYKKAYKIMQERGINEIPLLTHERTIQSIVNVFDLISENLCEKI